MVKVNKIFFIDDNNYFSLDGAPVMIGQGKYN